MQVKPTQMLKTVSMKPMRMMMVETVLFRMLEPTLVFLMYIKLMLMRNSTDMVIIPNQVPLILIMTKFIVPLKPSEIAMMKLRPTFLQLVSLKSTVVMKPTHMLTIVVVKPSNIVVVVVLKPTDLVFRKLEFLMKMSAMITIKSMDVVIMIILNKTLSFLISQQPVVLVKRTDMVMVKLSPTLCLLISSKIIVIWKLTEVMELFPYPYFVLLMFPKLVLFVEYINVVIVIRPNRTSLFLVTTKTFVSIKPTNMVVVGLYRKLSLIKSMKFVQVKLT